MNKLSELISESIKDRLVEVTSKPKRRRMRPQIVASTEEHRSQLLREIRMMDKAAVSRGEMHEPLVPVLFLWGMPRKRLSKAEAQVYRENGARIEYLKETEVKSLNL